MDVSYSMERQVEKIVNGLNKFVENLRQREDYQCIFFSVMLFSDKRRYLCRCMPISALQLFKKADFCEFGMTHLYDAIGAVLSEWLSEKTSKHHLFIITDGEDNGSKNINKDQSIQYCITAMAQGWNITHCGIDISKLGVKEIMYEVDQVENLLGSLNI